MRLNKQAYTKLVLDDLAWLMNQPKSLERDHIALILNDSIDRMYPKEAQKIDGYHAGDM